MVTVVFLCAGEGCGCFEARERPMSEYECNYCEAQFDSHSVLGGHVTSLHPYGDYRCKESGTVLEMSAKYRAQRRWGEGLPR